MLDRRSGDEVWWTTVKSLSIASLLYDRVVPTGAAIKKVWRLMEPMISIVSPAILSLTPASSHTESRTRDLADPR